MNPLEKLSGILVIDKPQGVTSSEVVEEIKKLLRVKKVGHGGTLDPIATGVLPIFINEATKVAQIFLEGDKLYVGGFKLGVETDTYDLTGEVLRTADASKITKEELERILPLFVGEIQQNPPPYSAAKYKGKPLYKYARDGLLITKGPKTVRVYEFKILEMEGDEGRFLLACSKGTYVRSIINELGKKLQCGSILCRLTRLKKSVFTLAEAVRLEEIRSLAERDPSSIKRKIIPIEKALEFLPSVIINEESAQKIRGGRKLATNIFFSWLKFQKISINPSDKWIRFVTPKRELIAIAENPFLQPSQTYVTFFKVFPNKEMS